MTVMTHRRGRSLGFMLGLVLLGVVLAVLVIAIVRTLRHPKPVHSTKPPVSAVVWGDRVFFNTAPLAHWLKTRGVHYKVWAKRHPPANKLLVKHHQAAKG
jgi:hypothetical protein